MNQVCPVCSSGTKPFRAFESFGYFKCDECGLITIDPIQLEKIDKGTDLVRYDSQYWNVELKAARERSFGIAMARLAEAILYCRIPVNRFIDIAAGPGFTLDAVARYLPRMKQKFWAVELFPPPKKYCTKSANFLVGTPRDLLPNHFDAGMCIEVIEHMTPKMVKKLFGEISEVAQEGACFLFNTGLASYAEQHPDYVDPFNRGHICFWTVKAINQLCSCTGLRAVELPGRDWAFLVEKNDVGCKDTIVERLETTIEKNLSLLSDGQTARSILEVLGKEAAWRYFYFGLFEQRTEWAVSLDKELKQRTQWAVSLDKELKQRTQWAVSLDKELKQRTQWALSLDKELKQRTQWALSLDKELEQRTQWALSLDKELKQRTQWALSLDKELEQRTQWALSLDKELKQCTQLALSLDKELKQRTQWALSLDKELKQRTKQLARLQKRISAIEKSTSWRITYPLRRLRRWVQTTRSKARGLM